MKGWMAVCALLAGVSFGCGGEEQLVSNEPFDVVLLSESTLGIRLAKPHVTRLGRVDQPCGWSPDHRRVCTRAFVRDGVTLEEYYNGPVSIITPDGVHRRVRDDFVWSPDGTHTALTGDAGAFIGDANAVRMVAVPSDQSPWAPSWSPDGSRVAFRATGNTPISNLDGTEFVEAPVADAASLAWSPDGARLMVASFGGSTLSLVDAGTGAVTPVASGVEFDALYGWSADGAWFAFGRPLRIVSADGDTLSDVGEVCGAGRAAWSPVEARLAFGACAEGREMLSTWSAGEVRELRLGTMTDLAWSPDGSAIVYTGPSADYLDYESILIDASDGAELARFLGAPSLSWNADGTALMSIATGTRILSVYDGRGQNGVRADLGAVDAMWLQDGFHIVVRTERFVRIVRADGGGVEMSIDATGAFLR